jgi:hypothetical protein
MKAFLWAIKYVWKYLVAEDVLQNSVEIRVHVSSVARWVTGPGELELSTFFPPQH